MSKSEGVKFTGDFIYGVAEMKIRNIIGIFECRCQGIGMTAVLKWRGSFTVWL